MILSLFLKRSYLLKVCIDTWRFFVMLSLLLYTEIYKLNNTYIYKLKCSIAKSLKMQVI